jgi:molybdopterin-synthase adenylyltransferase
VPERNEDRFSRQVALFGPEGQKRIGETRALIVGLGGLGSHLTQELTFLGVRDDALVDHDIITGSSRNRVIGSRPSDVVEKALKVDVARRLILEIATRTRTSSATQSSSSGRTRPSQAALSSSAARTTTLCVCS